MEYANEFLEYLKSNEKTFHIKNDERYYDFAKIPHSSTIDILFMNYNYYHKTSIDDKMEYCGFYNKENNMLYDISYNLKTNILKLDYLDNTYKNMSDLLKEFNTKVCNLVTDYVYENVEEFYAAAKDYETRVTEKDAYQYVVDNQKEIQYECGYNSSEKENILTYFEKGEEFIYEIAHNFIEQNREYIGKKLIDINKCNEFINKIKDDSNHPIHKRKEIVDIIKDGEYTNVHVFINKNGIDFDFKYDASVLKNYWDYSYLSEYNMPAPDRRNYEKIFGRHADFYYEDIYKIEYRGKPIYEDKNFIKDIIENSDKGEIVL